MGSHGRDENLGETRIDELEAEVCELKDAVEARDSEIAGLKDEAAVIQRDVDDLEKELLAAQKAADEANETRRANLCRILEWATKAGARIDDLLWLCDADTDADIREWRVYYEPLSAWRRPGWDAPRSRPTLPAVKREMMSF